MENWTKQCSNKGILYNLNSATDCNKWTGRDWVLCRKFLNNRSTNEICVEKSHPLKYYLLWSRPKMPLDEMNQYIVIVQTLRIMNTISVGQRMSKTNLNWPDCRRSALSVILLWRQAMSHISLCSFLQVLGYFTHDSFEDISAKQLKWINTKLEPLASRIEQNQFYSFCFIHKLKASISGFIYQSASSNEVVPILAIKLL